MWCHMRRSIVRGCRQFSLLYLHFWPAETPWLVRLVCRADNSCCRRKTVLQDFYNPAALDYQNITFLFPSATLHLTDQRDPDWPNPYTTCRTMNDDVLDVQMAFSQDGRSFTRLSTAPVVARGMGLRNLTTGIYDTPGSEWDAGMVFMATGAYHTTTEPGHLSMLHYGTQLTHGYIAYHVGDQYPVALRGFGRVRWRAEGFASMATGFHADDFAPSIACGGAGGSDPAVGIIHTVPLLLPTPWPPVSGDSAVELQLNVQTSVSGYLIVEVLDAVTMEPPLPGYRSLPIVANGLRVPVIWNATLSAATDCDSENGPGEHPASGTTRTDLSPLFHILDGRSILLRITMRDAQLYSITFAPPLQQGLAS